MSDGGGFPLQIPTPPPLQSSGAYTFQLSAPEACIEAFERLGAEKYAAASLQAQHLQSARRSANLVFLDWSANRGINLWAIGDEPLMIPLQPGVATITLPSNVVQQWDTYRRQVTVGAMVTLNDPLTPALINGIPILDAANQPQTVGPISGVFTTTGGSIEIQVEWPAHGLVVGSPVFFSMPLAAGGLTLPQFVLIDAVIDQNNFTFNFAMAAPESQTGQGTPPLFATTLGSPIVTVYLPNSNVAVNDQFPVNFQTVVGGLTIQPGFYSVTAVLNGGSFTIAPNAGSADSTTAVFENNGQIQIATQAVGVPVTDIFMWPISRNDYSFLPNKRVPGPPTSYWFNLIRPAPTVTVWPVPPMSVTPANYWMMIAYRQRLLQDWALDGTTVPDIPPWFYPAFVADLAAALAEKWSPALWEAKLTAAASVWTRAAASNVEHNTMSIVPVFQAFNY